MMLDITIQTIMMMNNRPSRIGLSHSVYNADQNDTQLKGGEHLGDFQLK